jgi:hypothetical protein
MSNTPMRARGSSHSKRRPAAARGREVAGSGTPPRWTEPAGLIMLIVVGAVAAVTLYVRWRLATVPLERDEGEYAYAGQLILTGLPPYGAVYNMKFPGAYYAYAAVMAVLGQTDWAIRMGLLIAHLATAGLVFAVARRWAGPRAAAQ